ncbi:MAG TPA: transcription termination/antitermination protein NusA [Chloroflexota bacterium]|jgi:N utilization substance protein A|nr:transcription termination/antitermination protein NusA [Chloroflexota bacterium]
MNTEFLKLIEQVSAEKRVPKEAILRAIESALVSAYRRNFGGDQDADVRVDRSTGEVRVYAKKLVVPEVKDERSEVSLGEAMRADPSANLGRSVDVVVTPPDFGRIAAQTARQVVLQRLRDVERDQLYAQFLEREGEVVAGQIRRQVGGFLIVEVEGANAILPPAEQVPTETYRPNQRLRVYVVEVTRGPRFGGPRGGRPSEVERELRELLQGPQIVVSRTHRNLLRRLFELEVPEIYTGVVEIKAIAREPGSRSKVAVYARQEGVDPVGSCVGMRGTRIQNVVSELHGEKIDVVQWDPDPAVFVANALSPAKVLRVELSEVDKTATILVPDRQLSLAIGREGQNARLAAKATGWRIDIKPGSSRGLDEPELVEAAQQPAGGPSEGSG